MERLSQIEEIAKKHGCGILHSEPMNKHTTFHIGGPADLFIYVSSMEALQLIKKSCGEEKIPCMICGKGSNMLVKDSGIRGVVLKLGSEFESISCEGTTITCGAGASLAALAVFAQKKGLSGLEFSYGIPGTVGGAAFMNAGAYGGEMKDVMVSCSHVDSRGEIGSYSGEKLQLSYRKSVYSGLDYVITSAKFELSQGEPQKIWERMKEYMSRREAKQPLEYPSAGSIFKRPEGQYAGTLIEQCGLKGIQIGGARVSEKHAGFIVNTGGATCEDVESLIHLIQETVEKKTGYFLECEVRSIS